MDFRFRGDRVFRETRKGITGFNSQMFLYPHYSIFPFIEFEIIVKKGKLILYYCSILAIFKVVYCHGK